MLFKLPPSHAMAQGQPKPLLIPKGLKNHPLPPLGWVPWAEWYGLWQWLSHWYHPIHAFVPIRLKTPNPNAIPQQEPSLMMMSSTPASPDPSATTLALPQPAPANLRHATAHQLWKQGHVNKALTLLNQHFEAAEATRAEAPGIDEPNQAMAWAQQGLYYAYQHHAWVTALLWLKRLQGLNPEHAQWHCTMAEVLLKLDDVDGAIEAYRTAIVFGHDYQWTASVAKQLGLLYYEQKQDMAKAVSCLKTALELDANNLDLQATLGDIYFEQGDYTQALTLFSKLLAKDPNNTDLLTYVGYLYWQLDDVNKAIATYEKALTLEPTHAIGFNNLGVIYLDTLGEAERALPYFNRACSLDATYVMARFNWARTHERLGHVAEARQGYQQALQLNHTSPELPLDDIAERLMSLG